MTVDKEYEVLAIWGGDYLILDDSKTDTLPYGNDPVIFHKSSFEITDPAEPQFWKDLEKYFPETYKERPA